MSNHLKLLTLDSKLFAVLPVETVIRDRQEGCYAALAQADSAGESTPFVEFLLDALHVALNEAVTSNVEHTDLATDQTPIQFKRFCIYFGKNLSRESQASWKN